MAVEELTSLCLAMHPTMAMDAKYATRELLLLIMVLLLPRTILVFLKYRVALLPTISVKPENGAIVERARHTTRVALANSNLFSNTRRPTFASYLVVKMQPLLPTYG